MSQVTNVSAPRTMTHHDSKKGSKNGSRSRTDSSKQCKNPEDLSRKPKEKYQGEQSKDKMTNPSSTRTQLASQSNEKLTQQDSTEDGEKIVLHGPLKLQKKSKMIKRKKFVQCHCVLTMKHIFLFKANPKFTNLDLEGNADNVFFESNKSLLVFSTSTENLKSVLSISVGKEKNCLQIIAGDSGKKSSDSKHYLYTEDEPSLKRWEQKLLWIQQEIRLKRTSHNKNQQNSGNHQDSSVLEHKNFILSGRSSENPTIIPSTSRGNNLDSTMSSEGRVSNAFLTKNDNESIGGENDKKIEHHDVVLENDTNNLSKTSHTGLSIVKTDNEAQDIVQTFNTMYDLQDVKTEEYTDLSTDLGADTENGEMEESYDEVTFSGVEQDFKETPKSLHSKPQLISLEASHNDDFRILNWTHQQFSCFELARRLFYNQYIFEKVELQELIITAKNLTYKKLSKSSIDMYTNSNEYDSNIPKLFNEIPKLVDYMSISTQNCKNRGEWIQHLKKSLDRAQSDNNSTALLIAHNAVTWIIFCVDFSFAYFVSQDLKEEKQNIVLKYCGTSLYPLIEEIKQNIPIQSSVKISTLCPILTLNEYKFLLVQHRMNKLSDIVKNQRSEIELLRSKQSTLEYDLQAEKERGQMIEDEWRHQFKEQEKRFTTLIESISEKEIGEMHKDYVNKVVEERCRTLKTDTNSSSKEMESNLKLLMDWKLSHERDVKDRIAKSEFTMLESITAITSDIGTLSSNYEKNVNIIKKQGPLLEILYAKVESLEEKVSQIEVKYSTLEENHEKLIAAHNALLSEQVSIKEYQFKYNEDHSTTKARYDQLEKMYNSLTTNHHDIIATIEKRISEIDPYIHKTVSNYVDDLTPSIMCIVNRNIEALKKEYVKLHEKEKELVEERKKLVKDRFDGMLLNIQSQSTSPSLEKHSSTHKSNIMDKIGKLEGTSTDNLFEIAKFETLPQRRRDQTTFTSRTTHLSSPSSPQTDTRTLYRDSPLSQASKSSPIITPEKSSIPSREGKKSQSPRKFQSQEFNELFKSLVSQPKMDVSSSIKKESGDYIASLWRT